MIMIRGGSIEAVVATETGNQVQSIKFNGHEILWMPKEAGKLGGIPLLAPWANRLDSDAYLANRKRYRLNPDIVNIRRDANGLPIHGLLLFCEGWRVVQQDAASVTSRLEFWRHPEWMAQFPFAHAIEITHRIVNDAFEVETAIENLSTEPMPLSIGFHPYFQLTDSPRDDWKLTIPARESVVLTPQLIPNGNTVANQFVQPFPLAGTSLDSVFTGLTGDAFVADGHSQRISVKFGPKFPVGIVYAPSGQSFFCFEPMTALTNVFNNAFNTPNAPLQQIAPGDTWRESFWIKPKGF